MRIVLQSQDNYNEIAVLDLDTGNITVFSKRDQLDLSSSPTNGYFSIMGGRMVCFFRSDEQLMVKIDDQTIGLRDEDTVLLEPVQGNWNRFRILRDKETLFSWVYERPEIYPSINFSQFFNPLIADEDFDICLFIYNVMNDPGRKERVFRRLFSE